MNHRIGTFIASVSATSEWRSPRRPDSDSRRLLSDYIAASLVYLAESYSLVVVLYQVEVADQTGRCSTPRPVWATHDTCTMPGSIHAFFHAVAQSCICIVPFLLLPPREGGPELGGGVDGVGRQDAFVPWPCLHCARGTELWHPRVKIQGKRDAEISTMTAVQVTTLRID